VESHFDIQIPKHDARIVKIKDKIDSEYAADRVSVISDDEMFDWVKEAFEGDLPPVRKD
jgi:hypothetical protein